MPCSIAKTKKRLFVGLGVLTPWSGPHIGQGWFQQDVLRQAMPGE